MKTLFLIPARGGSKGIPKKNIKLLNGKPLICYSIDVARQLTSDDLICVSSDDDEIIKVVENYGLTVPFKRPAELATDEADSYSMIRHAIEYFKSIGKDLDVVVLLQPTSPFRKSEQVQEAINLFSPELDMVISCFETEANPYYLLFEENAEGFLMKSKELTNFVRRQQAPKVYQLNGAIYVLNVSSLKKFSSFNELKKKKKFIMDKVSSLDIDTPLDWTYAEFLIEKGIVKINN